MANLITLYINDREVEWWKWSIPEYDKPFLRFIFKKEDVAKSEEEFEYGALQTTVSEVKARFDALNLNLENFNKIISDLWDIPLEKIDFALLSLYEFYDEYDLLEEYDEGYAAWLKLESEKYFLESIKEKIPLGNLIKLRKVRYMLEESTDEDIVRLEYQYSFDEVKVDEDLNLLDEYESKIKLDKKYLEYAQIHFTTEEFDLVYLELIIALENAINAYIRKKSDEVAEKSDIKIDKLTKNISLIDLVVFSVVYLGRKKIENELIESLIKTYNMRNNIIHNQARTFKLKEVAEAIKTVTEIIKLLSTLE